MDIQFVSDLHLRSWELHDYTLPGMGADLLVLAGDLANGFDASLAWARRQAQALGIPTVWVAGNHEYYGEVWPADLEALQAEYADDRVDLRLLDHGETVVGEVRILGATLWTDFLLYGAAQEEKALSAAGALLNDYRGVIRKSDGRKLRVRDTQAACLEACRWLEHALARPWPGKTLVVTHHAPHRRAAHPAYRDFATAGFVSDLRALVAAHRIDAWISGHTHYNHDFIDHGTRFLSNQRGYPNESIPGAAFEAGKLLEL